jgi:hypothetical protein
MSNLPAWVAQMSEQYVDRIRKSDTAYSSYSLKKNHTSNKSFLPFGLGIDCDIYHGNFGVGLNCGIQYWYFGEWYD